MRKEAETQDFEGKFEMERMKNEKLAQSLDQYMQLND